MGTFECTFFVLEFMFMTPLGSCNQIALAKVRTRPLELPNIIHMSWWTVLTSSCAEQPTFMGQRRRRSLELIIQIIKFS